MSKVLRTSYELLFVSQVAIVVLIAQSFSTISAIHFYDLYKIKYP